MKKIIVLTLTLVLALSFLACSSKSTNDMDIGDPPRDSYGSGMDMGFTSGSSQSSSEEAGDANTETAYLGYKIIKNAQLHLLTKHFDDDIATIESMISQYSGYIASSEIQGTKPQSYGDNSRNATLIIRIKQENLDTFLSSAGDLCEVTYKNISTDDVTTQYFDTQSRLKVYQKQYDRILELIEEAKNIEDLIALESELTRITYEIEYLTTEINRLDDLIKYSTVTLRINEKNTLSNISSSDGFFARIAEGFLLTLSRVGVFFADFFAAIIIYSPIIILVAAAVAVVLFIRKKKGKLFAKKKDKSIEPEEINDNEQ